MTMAKKCLISAVSVVFGRRSQKRRVDLRAQISVFTIHREPLGFKDTSGKDSFSKIAEKDLFSQKDLSPKTHTGDSH